MGTKNSKTIVVGLGVSEKTLLFHKRYGVVGPPIKMLNDMEIPKERVREKLDEFWNDVETFDKFLGDIEKPKNDD